VQQAATAKVVTKAIFRHLERPSDLTPPGSQIAPESAPTKQQSEKFDTPVTFACYTEANRLLQLLLLIWEGRLPHGNQAH